MTAVAKQHATKALDSHTLPGTLNATYERMRT